MALMKSKAEFPQGVRYVTDYEVKKRLAELGLSRGLLAEAAFQGHLDRLRATRLDFAGRGEYDAASMALRVLAEEGGKTSAGWHRSSHRGIPVVFDRDERIAITVT